MVSCFSNPFGVTIAGTSILIHGYNSSLRCDTIEVFFDGTTQGCVDVGSNITVYFLVT